MLLPGPPQLPPTGVVLAGGPGRRMGGNKPQRTLAGHRLIDLALANAARVCGELIVVTGKVTDFADLACTVLADRWPGAGPMAAVATAMLESRAESFLVLPVDLPLLRTEVLNLIIEKTGRTPACAPESPGGISPIPGLYRRACLPQALRLLEQGEKRIRFLIKAVGGVIIPRAEVLKADPEDLSFLNVNYPEDLAAAERLALERGLLDTAP